MWRQVVAWLGRWPFAATRGRLDDEARAEMAAHLELLTERHMRLGMPLDEARLAARQQFGNATIARERLYDMNSLSLLETALQDLRYAGRQLFRHPGFTFVVCITLALGIGGTTAVFSVVHHVLLAPLPYEQPAQLVRLYQTEPGNPAGRQFVTSVHFRALRTEAAAFEEVAAIATYSETGLDLIAGGTVQRLRVLPVSSGYFRTLRSVPVYGREFDRDDEKGTRRVVLSDRTWRKHFQADPALIGANIQLSAEPYEVAGVAPADLIDPIAGEVDAWIPSRLATDNQEENYSLATIGRLRNSVSLDQARAELAGLAPSMKDRWPAARQSAFAVVPLHEDLVAPVRGPLRLILAAVALVLLVACLNVANLVLVRAMGRSREFALRAALGARTTRLARQLLTESLLLAILGGGVGLLFTRVAMSVLENLGRTFLPRLEAIGFHPMVLGFALVTTISAALASGLTPVLRLTRTPPDQSLRSQSRSSTGTPRQARLRRGIAAAQLALAFALLAGAGVLMASFYRLQQVDLGFRVDRLFTFELHLPAARYEPHRRAVFQETLAHAIEAVPGVTAAGGISRLPATGSYHPWNTHLLTGPRAGTTIGRSRGFNIQQRVVSGNLFAALGIHVLAGRRFDARDDSHTPARALVSANFARQAFPGQAFEAALGHRIRAGGRELEIIGVVGDVALDQYGTPTMVVYRSHRQFADDRNWALTQVVRSERAGEDLMRNVRTVIAAFDPELVVYRPAPMADILGRQAGRERFALVLMAAFATLALLLAALGLYGVVAYTVRERTPEIGIRMALGATSAQVRGLIFRQGGGVIALGAIGGLAGALALNRLLSTLLFQVDPWDLRIFSAAAILLLVVALGAIWVPARRASRIDPARGLLDG